MRRNNPLFDDYLKLIFLVALLFSQGAHSALISTNAGKISSLVVTSREVLINHLIERALASEPNSAKISTSLNPSDVRSSLFVRETTSVLLELAIYQEAESFAAPEIPQNELQAKIKLVQKKLAGNSLWNSLEVDSKELQEMTRKKLKAKNFIRFKVESGAIPITDQEAREYFNNNKLKFENLPFESFKENIKKYLAKQQVDRRLKDWFELIQSKYKVRNYLAE